MNFNSLKATCTLLAALTFAPMANAHVADFHFPEVGKASAETYGKTLPPIGYVQFCANDEEECKFQASISKRLAITSEKWNQIEKVNSYVNARIKPESDKDIYGKADLWTYPVDVGDCEDYVLLKKRYLQELGFNSADLPITFVLDEHGEGHAVLTIITSKGDYVLDNRRDDIMLWNKTGYRFLKRQSQEQATLWLSLQKRPEQGSGNEVSVSTR